MVDKIEKILKSVNINDFGFCNLSEITNFISYHGKEIIPETGHVIVVLFPYKVKEYPPKNISRYAAVPDYHNVCGKILKEAAEKLKEEFKDNLFLPLIDHSPIPEVYTAVKAGLGIRGKNGLLLTKKYGSFVFIGEIVTDLNFSFVKENIENDACLFCGKCEENCPTASIAAGDKSTCYSKITQQKKPLLLEQEELLKKVGCIWGCDKCQDCCPYNNNTQKTEIAEFLQEYRSEYTIGEKIEQRAFAWRGKAVIERNAKIINENI